MELIPSIFLFAATAALTPGPNNIMLMASGLNFGVRASMPHLLGICVGFPVMMILIGLGLGFIFERYPACHLLIKIAGVTYLFYLAWRMTQASAGEEEGKRGRALTFIAPSAEEIQQHASAGGFPANSIAEIKSVIDSTTAE